MIKTILDLPKVSNNRTNMERKVTFSGCIENDLVSVFLMNQAHSALLSVVLHNPSEENKRLIVHTFQNFIFQIRFTKYLSSLIHFADIDYHRKRKRVEERNELIFDTPISEEGETTLGEQLLQEERLRPNNPTYNPELFFASIEDFSLHKALSKLTDRQKYVITLAYSACELDTEIACTLQVSQQAVTKTRLTALKKMRNYLEHNRSTRKGVL